MSDADHQKSANYNMYKHIEEHRLDKEKHMESLQVLFRWVVCFCYGFFGTHRQEFRIVGSVPILVLTYREVQLRHELLHIVWLKTLFFF